MLFTKGKFFRLSSKMISIPIGKIYAQVAKSATSYYSLIVLPLTNFTLHPLTFCVIDKGIKVDLDKRIGINDFI